MKGKEVRSRDQITALNKKNFGETAFNRVSNTSSRILNATIPSDSAAKSDTYPK